MDHRMCVTLALITLILVTPGQVHALTPGTDGPVKNQESLEGGETALKCDTATGIPGDEFMLMVWYKNNTPIYSYDARIGSESEWSSDNFNVSSRLYSKLHYQPTELHIRMLDQADEGLYHCRVDFLVAPTYNIWINLTVVVLPSQPFFLDEIGNKVQNKIGPYHEGDTLVISCLVIGGRPPPRISWYSGEILIDESDGASDIPGVKENVLYLPLTREHTAPLSCQATNTALTRPVISKLQIEIYLPAENVTISWVKRTSSGQILQAGQPAVARCIARGSHPQPDLIWSLNQKHLTPRTNQTWRKDSGTAESVLEFSPRVNDDGATLSCIATNVALTQGRGSKADVIRLNVTYSPILEVVKIGDDKPKDIVELDILHLICEIKANPPVNNIVWYFNESQIIPYGLWETVNMTGDSLVLLEARRHHTGQYSCSASNAIGETRSHHITITVLYPPQCTHLGITLSQETVTCNINALPTPDTYFWHVQATGYDVQQLTTGSPLLPLSQLLGPLSGMLHVVCEAANGIASQEKACERTLSLTHLRPRQPQQCDLAYEENVFKIRCIQVENATYYEVSVWKMSSANTSLVLERQTTMGWAGPAPVLAAGAGGGEWLVRGEVGKLRDGDEAGAAACNRYGCSRALLLRPSKIFLAAAAPPWWHVFLEKDVGIAVGAVVLVVVFVISTLLLRKMLGRGHRAKPPVIQVLQLDDVAREYLESIEHKHHASCSVRSCSSGYSGGSMDDVPPTVDRQRKPPIYFWDPGPPPDVTLTLSRESAV